MKKEFDGPVGVVSITLNGVELKGMVENEIIGYGRGVKGEKMQKIFIQLPALKKSIEHWERMVEWAVKQVEEKKGDEIADSFFMFTGMGESWQGSYCHLCILNEKITNSNSPFVVCANCIIVRDNKKNDCNGDNSLWRRVNHSRNWKEWLKNGKKMLKFLKKLHKKYSKIEQKHKKQLKKRK